MEPTPLVTVLPCEADKEAAHHFNLYITNGCINGVEEAELASLFAKRAANARLAALEAAAKKERAWYAALRSAQHALDIIARGSISAQGRRDLETLAREESDRIEQALTAIRSLSQPVEGSAGAGNERCAVCGARHGHATTCPLSAAFDPAASNKGGRDGE